MFSSNSAVTITFFISKENLEFRTILLLQSLEWGARYFYERAFKYIFPCDDSAGRLWVPVNESISLTSPQITGQLKKKENELDSHHSEIL